MFTFDGMDTDLCQFIQKAEDICSHRVYLFIYSDEHCVFLLYYSFPLMYGHFFQAH